MLRCAPIAQLARLAQLAGGGRGRVEGKGPGQKAVLPVDRGARVRGGRMPGLVGGFN
jgi:hypothetical protein